MKLPIIEETNRWIDCFAYFDYSDDIRHEAQYIALQIIDRKKMMKPKTLALISLIIACKRYDKEFEIIKANKIIEAYLGDRTGRHHVGKLSYLRIRKRAERWESSQLLK